MRNLTALIATMFICAALIVPASAEPMLVEMNHDEAATYVNEKMGNWTDSDLGAWLVGHAYLYKHPHGFFTPMYNPDFIFKVAKTETLLNKNGFACAQMLATIDVTSDPKNQMNGIAVKICVKGDTVTVEIANTMLNKTE